MSELRDVEDAFDSSLDRADRVMEMIWKDLGGDVAEEIRLAGMLSEFPVDLRELCDLDYYRLVADHALGTGCGSEVA